ncbi:hypothetical protein PLICRDRAFT_56158 [Plicaturopsis crispa FD-325 SS-3]|nr:hypothetical protein PLICRDRAFT_56158 [Plicaturopsis crispa FD-325 SS-3]
MALFRLLLRILNFLGASAMYVQACVRAYRRSSPRFSHHPLSNSVFNVLYGLPVATVMQVDRGVLVWRACFRRRPSDKYMGGLVTPRLSNTYVTCCLPIYFAVFWFCASSRYALSFVR